jgi:hypothetical protein
MLPIVGGELVDLYDRKIRGKYRDMPRSIRVSPV